MPHCKPGDLAMITHDVPSCSANIGRIVVVDGPSRVNRRNQLTWLIQPVTDEPYMINGRDGEFVRFMDYREHGIEHPDPWMMPIRPGDLKAAGTPNEEGLATERNDARTLPPAPLESEAECCECEEIRP